VYLFIEMLTDFVYNWSISFILQLI
jgi:hypothetical protein